MSIHHRIVRLATQGLKHIFGVIWLSGTRIHRQWRARRRPIQSPPVLVIGSLRAGGTGKTDLVAWIAQRHPLLAVLVHPTGDEDRMLLAQFPGRVFAHRDFLMAWAMAEGAGFGAAICDGGLQDPALGDCSALCLNTSPPPKGPADLLPIGHYRELAPQPRRNLHHFDVELDLTPTLSAPSLPPPGTKIIAACSIARPQAFFADLERNGFQIQERLAFRDHANFDPARVRHTLARHGSLVWLLTEKDVARGELLQLPCGSAAAKRILTPSAQVVRTVDEWVSKLSC